jgi:ATP-binding cassette subfamily B protein
MTETDPSNTPLPDQSASSRAVLQRLLPYLGRYRGRLLISAVALLIAAAVTLSIPVAFRFLIDETFSRESSEAFSTARVNGMFLLLFVLAVLLGLSTALRFYSVSWLGDRITADLRADVFTSVLRQDPRFFESLKTGEVLSRLQADTTLIQSLIGSSISLGLRNTVLFAGALGMMLFTSLKLAMVILGLLLVVVLPIFMFGRRVRSLSRTSQDQLADTGALASETLNAIGIVQAYVREPLESERYIAATDRAFNAAIRRNRSRSLLTATAIILVFGAIVFTLWLGAQAVIEGTLTAGLLAQFMLYAAIVGGSTGVIAEVYGDLQRAAGATTRLLELLNAKPAIIDSAGAKAVPSLPSGAAIRFSQVNFNYPSRPHVAALTDISFDIEAGQTVALVGPSGAGKTTVLQLLLRYYDPQSGAITLNGQPLTDTRLESLRQNIGLVSQDSVVFSANAMENIRYGKLDASDDEVIAAAKSAQAHEFIMALPDGYQTYVGERGVRLSGGQRQRLSIARALLKNPPLLLLDEATSALDADSERKVQTALEQAMHQRTTLVIAHRLATVVKADRIIVLDKGKIAESGTHETLTQNNSLYAKLAAMQFTR